MRRKTERERQFYGEIGRQLTYWREARGVKRQELAKAAGIKVVTMGRYERGQAAIPLLPLLRCAAALRVTFADLVGPATQKRPTYQN